MPALGYRSKMKLIGLCIVTLFFIGCGSEKQPEKVSSDSAPRIVSLDFCADQYVLGLLEKDRILALSPDAEKSFSYEKEKARGVRTVRPSIEDILLLRPDIVVRTYGGGPMITAFLERAGIKVIQIDYTSDLASVMAAISKTAQALDVPARGQEIIDDMEERLSSIRAIDGTYQTMYLTSKGAIASQQTLIDELFSHAGLVNFSSQSGWSRLPLERLAYEKPDLIATGFFETSDRISDIWTSTRHPVVKRALKKTPRVDIPGALTACNSWSLIDAVEILSAADIGPAQ